MRIGVVADATCDLPAAFYREHRIEVLPTTIRLGDETLVDTRDPETTLHFYAEQLASRGLDADTSPPSADAIRQQLLARAVLDYDYVFCVTLTATRSPIFEHATKASFAILNDYKDVRAAAGIREPFALRVVDSRNMFAGTGVLVAEAANLVRAGAPPLQIRERLDALREEICGYLVPDDLYYIRNRAIRKGEQSVGFLSYAIGSVLDIKPVLLCHRGETEPVAKIRNYQRAVEKLFAHVAAQLREGISTRHVCLSYGGDPARIHELPGYELLAQAAQDCEVEILSSILSATAAVNAGGGCLAIAYGGPLRPFSE